MSVQPTHVPDWVDVVDVDVDSGGEAPVFYYYCTCDAEFLNVNAMVLHGQRCDELVRVEDELERFDLPLGSRTTMPGWVSSERELLDVTLAMMAKRARPEWIVSHLRVGLEVIAARQDFAAYRADRAAARERDFAEFLREFDLLTPGRVA